MAAHDGLEDSSFSRGALDVSEVALGAVEDAPSFVPMVPGGNQGGASGESAGDCAETGADGFLAVVAVSVRSAVGGLKGGASADNGGDFIGTKDGLNFPSAKNVSESTAASGS